MFSINIYAQVLPPRAEEYRQHIRELLSFEIDPAGPRPNRGLGGSCYKKTTVHVGMMEMTISISDGRLNPRIDRSQLHNKIVRVILESPPSFGRVIPEVIYLKGNDDHFSERWTYHPSGYFHYHGDGSRNMAIKEGPGDYLCIDCQGSITGGPLRLTPDE